MALEERPMRRALELARESIDAGDRPFGSVLVLDGEIVAEARNTVYTEDDVTAHPELKLARWAGAELSESERRETTMYTSTAPCEMCSGAIARVGLGRVVYSTSISEITEILETDTGKLSSEILEPNTSLVGPLLPEHGREIHDSYW